MSYETEIGDRLFVRKPRTIAAADAAASRVVDLRGMRAFKAWFSSGTVTYTPCDSEGTALTGASAVGMTAATEVLVGSSFVLIEPSASCVLDVY
ncbi:MAG: hypothetical protein AB7I13_00300 [Vicinamibacterales bacterium]